MSVILATAGYDHKIRFWEAPSGVCSRILKFPGSQVNKLEISPDKQFLAAGGNPLIRIYEVSPAMAPSPMQNGHAHTHNDPHHQQQAAYRQQNHQQSQQQQHQQQQNQDPVLTLEGHTASVTSLGFQRDGGYLFSGSEDGTIKLWDLRAPTYSRSFDCGAPVHSVTLRADRDEIISGDATGSIKVWNLGGHGVAGSGIGNANGNEAFHSNGNGHGYGYGYGYAGHGSNGINSASSRSANNGGGGSGHFNPKATRRKEDVSRNSKGCMYQVRPGGRGAAQTSPIQSVDISEDSRILAAASSHGTVFIFDPNPVSSNASPYASVAPERFDGQRESFSATSAQLSSTPLLTPVAQFRAHPVGSYCLHAKIAPSCRHLCTTGSDGTAKLWDTSNWELTHNLQSNPNNHRKTQSRIQGVGGGGNGVTSSGSSCWVWDAAFCADSSYLVTASSDHTARLWNLQTAQVVRHYHGHSSSVTCVALNDSSV